MIDIEGPQADVLTSAQNLKALCLRALAIYAGERDVATAERDLSLAMQFQAKDPNIQQTRSKLLELQCEHYNKLGHGG